MFEYLSIVTMRELLIEVAGTYDQGAGTGADVAGQLVLRGVAQRTDLSCPEGFVIRGYGGQGSASTCPWIGVFDPVINDDPKTGLYVAFIFSADLSAVTLTLQQGVTELEPKFSKRRDFYSYLEGKAVELRSTLPDILLDGWQARPLFGSTNDRPLAYEAASVAARRYEIGAMPSDAALHADLKHVANLLQRVSASGRAMEIDWSDHGLVLNFKGDSHSKSGGLGGFVPKDSSEYKVKIPAREAMRSKDHERLIAEFGPYVAARGFAPKNQGVHPKDVTLQLAGEPKGPQEEWLVEAKVVRKGNVTQAVREAVGQLKEYSYFLYGESKLPRPHLLGLFTEDIGAYATYLEAEGIASLWQTEDGWAGSPMAVSWGLVEPSGLFADL
ncbi:MrcB family domain-containing protein [Streptomyces sp. NPDC059398]|uniref:MrcB family domain-containing protein n=1 Tax=Streptomyces sp. NPDC059398 TaxID=3346820 RepID=UPI0036B7FEED